MFSALRAALAIIGVLLVSGCDEDAQARCILGQQVKCTCIDGEVGVRSCSAEGTYRECDCSYGDEGFIYPPEKPERPMKRVETKPVDASMPAEAPSRTTLWTGTDRIVDVFVHRAGVVVLTTGAVYLVDRTGAQLAVAMLSGELGLASFADDILAIMDGNTLKLWQVGPKLARITQLDLGGEPEALVMVSDERLVCAVNSELRTYAARTGELLGKESYLSGDRDWRQVPASARFVSRYQYDYLLHEVGDDQIARVIARSDAIGESGPGFAFDGVPAQHIVTVEGTLISLQARECQPPRAADQPRCLMPDGALGIGRLDPLDSSAEHMFALRYRSTEQDFLLRSIDVSARTVRSERVLSHFEADEHLRVDDETDQALLGYRIGPPVPDPQYAVELVEP